MFDYAEAFVALSQQLADVPVDELNELTATAEYHAAVADAIDRLLQGWDSQPGDVGPLVMAGALHDVLPRADPRIEDAPARALQPYRTRFLQTGNLRADAHRGALVVVHTYPTRPQSGPTTLSEVFPRLRIVDSGTWARTRWRTLSRLRDIDRMPNTPLRIASLPILAAGDVTFNRSTNGVQSYYTAQPVTAPVSSRITRALRALDATDAHVALLPESACDDTLLDEWRRACLAVPCTSALRLLLVGTGPITASVPTSATATVGPGTTTNRAAVLDRRTGEILLLQDKQRGFSMDDTYLGRAGLTALMPGPVDERIPVSPSLNVLNSLAGRLGVLICEDLGRVTDIGAHAVAVGISHVFAPILATPIIGYRWQQTAGTSLLAEGTAVIVVNSIALGRYNPIDGTTVDRDTPAITMLALYPNGCNDHTHWSGLIVSSPESADRGLLKLSYEDDALTPRVVDLC